jgi:dolichol-phosphate mannosyltransferase
MRLLSVVVPFYNESSLASQSLHKIADVLESATVNFEMIAINDGSKDDTLAHLYEFKKSRDLRIISSLVNKGHMSALRAGLRKAKGDLVVTIDGDLQEDPSNILKMLDLFNSDQNLRVVQAVRTSRDSDGWFKRTTANIYYRLIKFLTKVDVRKGSADFRMMHVDVVKDLNALNEKECVYRLLIPYIGYQTYFLDVVRTERISGRSKYSLKKMFSLAINSFVAFTYHPLRIVIYIGFAGAFILLLVAIWSIYIKMMGHSIPGWTSIVLMISCVNFLIIGLLGILSEYVGRIYEIILNRPDRHFNELP